MAGIEEPDWMERNFDGPARRKAARDELQLRKTAMDAELRMKGYDPETMNVIPGSDADVKQAQNQQVLQMANALQGKLAAQDTDQAILDYSQTGDASYLQGALDKNPAIKQAWNARGVQQVGNLDWQNDTQLLGRAGFSPSEYDTAEKQDILKKNVYKFYDGKEWKVGLLNTMVAETGAVTRLGNNRAQPIMDNFQNFRNFMAGPRSSANTAEGHKYESDIMAAAEETGVPPNLIAAMMNQESAGNPNAVSPKGASGLMQLMPATAKELGVTDINNPRQNIMAGARYMKQQLEKYNGDTRLALAAYNAGPGAVDKYNGIPPFAETQNYVTRIMDNYAAGESYYNAGAAAVKEGQQMGNRPSVSSPDIQGENMRGNRNADNTIATIQNFIRGNANAAKGTTNEMADMAVRSDAVKAAAALKQAGNEGTTAPQKDLYAAEQHTKNMLADFGGEEEFFKTDFSDPKNYNKAWQNVVKINKLEGTTLTQEDKKNITDMRALIGLSDPASKLTSGQTGIVDSYLSNVEKYISDSGKGVEKKAAMAAFRNTLRNALFGSALTDGEIAAFNEAFGTNSQKLGPVLEQFKVALAQVKTKLDSTAQLGNPYTMKVMLGADQERMLKIQDSLQQRIDYIEGKYKPDSSAPPAPGQTAKNENRPSLDAIFGAQPNAN